MNEVNIPVQSLKTLIISMISALILAFLILVVFIGPAEYGIDPTGLGKKLGLTVLAKPLAENVKRAVSCPTGEQAAGWQDIVQITIPARSGLEYKFYLQKNAQITYVWSSDNEALYFDFHGEPAGDKSGYFKSYRETTANASEGDLTAPFTGTHGWYWKNDTNKTIQVTLKTKGQYEIKGLI